MDHTGHNHEGHCCAHEPQAKKPVHHTSLAAAHHATLHCLTGCVMGEVAGLLIGVHFGLEPWVTIILATTLAYISGFALSVFPLMRRTKLSFTAALKAIWLGEVISIGIMELVMNTVDYHMGGMTAASVMHWQFWQGLLLAIPAGYIAALPVNAWLIGRQLKKCH